MATNMDTRCLYTIVKNTSGKTLTFSFLPPHGVELAHGEEYSVFGDIGLAIAAGSGRDNARRDIMAFQQALEDQVLAVVQTPSPILRDTVTGEPRALTVANGVLSLTDPCWVSTLSDIEPDA